MFCNRPDKKGVSRSDPADTYFSFFSAENAKAGRPAETAQTPRKEKRNDHLFRLTTPFCRMMFAYCEVSPLCTM